LTPREAITLEQGVGEAQAQVGQEQDHVHHGHIALDVTHLGDLLHHVEGHGLVFHLFHRVPRHHGAELRVGASHGFLLLEEGLRQHGREVLERTGQGQVVFLREVLRVEGVDPLDEAGDRVHVQAPVTQQLVVARVHDAMLSLLTDEGLHLFLQLGVGDLVAEGAHAGDEVALAIREGGLDRVDQARLVGVVLIPPAGGRVVNAELQLLAGHHLFGVVQGLLAHVVSPCRQVPNATVLDLDRILGRLTTLSGPSARHEGRLDVMTSH